MHDIPRHERSSSSADETVMMVTEQDLDGEIDESAMMLPPNLAGSDHTRKPVQKQTSKKGRAGGRGEVLNKKSKPSGSGGPGFTSGMSKKKAGKKK